MAGTQPVLLQQPPGILQWQLFGDGDLSPPARAGDPTLSGRSRLAQGRAILFRRDAVGSGPAAAGHEYSRRAGGAVETEMVAALAPRAGAGILHLEHPLIWNAGHCAGFVAVQLVQHSLCPRGSATGGVRDGGAGDNVSATPRVAGSAGARRRQRALGTYGHMLEGSGS